MNHDVTTRHPLRRVRFGNDRTRSAAFDHGARVREDQGIWRLEITQDIDDRVFAVTTGHRHRLIVDVSVLRLFGGGRDTDCIALVLLGQ